MIGCAQINARPDHARREHYLEVGCRVRVIANDRVWGGEGIIKEPNVETRIVIRPASIVRSVGVQVDADLPNHMNTREPLEIF